MKRLFGFLALLLGGIGLLAALAGAVVVWPVSSQYLGQATELCESAEESCKTITTRMKSFDARIEKVDSALTSIKTTAENVAKNGKKSDPADQAKVEAIVANLSAGVEKVQHLMQTLRTLADSVLAVGKLTMQVSKNSTGTDRLRSVVHVIEEAESAVDDIKKKLNNLPGEKQLQNRAKMLATSATALLQPVSKLSSQVEEVNASLTQVQEDLTEAHQLIDYWKTNGPIIGTVILIWIAIAQLCLFQRGCSMLRSEKTT